MFWLKSNHVSKRGHWDGIMASSAPPDSKLHGANMGTTWGRKDPGGPHVGPMNLAIWACNHTVTGGISGSHFGHLWLWHLLFVQYVCAIVIEEKLLPRFWSFVSYLSDATRRLVLSCLILVYLVWPKINKTHAWLWLLATLVVKGLHHVFREIKYVL